VVTFVVLGGAGLAQTRVRFEWRETVINRKIEDNPAIANTALSDDLKRFPKLGFPIWLVALWAIIIAGALTLVSAWWPVETPAHERGGGLTSEMRDRIAFLERELDRRADETTELRRIIETRTCRTPEIEPPREAPSDALPGSGASGGTGTGD